MEQAFYKHTGIARQQQVNTTALCMISLERAKSEMHEAYGQVCRPAKKLGLLLIVISDMDTVESEESPSAGQVRAMQCRSCTIWRVQV